MKKIKKMLFPLKKTNRLNFNKMLSDPFLEFKKWYKISKEEKCITPEKMSLATIYNNRPIVRYVSMAEITEKNNKIIFLTNYQSKKSLQIEKNKNIAIAFHWPEIALQIKIEGTAKKLERKIIKKYFSELENKKKYFITISQGTHKVGENEFLDYEKKLEKFDEKNFMEDFLCPDFYDGYEILPKRYEFYKGNDCFASERVSYEVNYGKWEKDRLLF